MSTIYAEASKSTILTIGGERYLIDPTSIGSTRPLDEYSARYVPATVASSWSGDGFGHTDLQHVRAEFTAAGDDVWSEAFLEGEHQKAIRDKTDELIPSVIILPSAENVNCESDFNGTAVALQAGQQLSNGPYVIESRTGAVYSVARLFKDTHYAFFRGLLPDAGRKYKLLDEIDVSRHRTRKSDYLQC
jgi:hypothetical protein